MGDEELWRYIRGARGQGLEENSIIAISIPIHSVLLLLSWYLFRILSFSLHKCHELGRAHYTYLPLNSFWYFIPLT